MLVLARLLPFEHLRLLETDLADLEAEVFAAPLLEGLPDSRTPDIGLARHVRFPLFHAVGLTENFSFRCVPG